MRKIISAFLLLSAASLGLAAPRLPEEPALTQAVVRAGTLRTQSQRLAKLHLQIRLDVNAAAARKQLAAGMADVDRLLEELAALPAAPKTAKTLARSRELWAQLRTELAAAPGAHNAARINHLSDDLMIASGKLAFQIEEEMDSPSGRLVDLSIRQNMLAQRLAKLYMLAQLGDRSHGVTVDMQQARTEFGTALNELATARENSRSIQEHLELARMQWIFFDNALGQMGQKELAGHVATSSERIMQMMEGVAGQYAAAQRGPASVALGAAPRRN